MDLTHEDIQRAFRISKAIQEYLINTGQKGARSTDVYEYLARKGLIEKDRHNGFHFRNFLLRLKNADLLKLIPQCTHKQSETGGNEWYFYLASDNRTALTDIKLTGKKAEIVYKPQMTIEEINQLLNSERPNVEKLPKRDSSEFTYQEREIRRNYPRAYEYWSDVEIDIMVRVYVATKNIYKVAELLHRQPHIIKERLSGLNLL